MIMSLPVSLRTGIAALCLLMMGACADLNTTEQRVLTGGAIGATAGAAGTVLTGGCVACGAAVGGVLGAGTGYVVDRVKRGKRVFR